MSLYIFTNRRRAKDAIMILAEKASVDDITIFVRDGLVYVNVDADVPNLGVIMHYAQICPDEIEKFLKLEEITELYRGDGILKFRV